jgi:hypothetical protein
MKIRRGKTAMAIVIVLLAGISAFPTSWAPTPRAAEAHQAAVPRDLDTILKKTAEYCRKLESVAFDFICREEIAEKIDPNLEVGRPLVPNWTSSNPGSKIYVEGRAPDIKNSYIYDYQCIRADRKVREVRILLEENRKKKNEPDARLKTAVFVFGNVIQGPVGLYGERFQAFYKYKISGNDKIAGRKVVIVDSLPRVDDPEAKNLFGKAWIDIETFEILKIEWSEKRVGNYDIFQKRGEKFNRVPRLTLRSEFSVEKNGIRFPSKLFIEEAYLNERGRAFVRSETTVTYKDFKFFTVEVEVK